MSRSKNPYPYLGKWSVRYGVPGVLDNKSLMIAVELDPNVVSLMDEESGEGFNLTLAKARELSRDLAAAARLLEQRR